MKRVLCELKIVMRFMKVFCDNHSTISISKNLVHHDRTKHVEIHKNFVKEKLETEMISILYILTSHQIVDILTKVVPRVTFDELNSKLGLLNIYNLA